jgi:hypothetical protein
VNRDLGLKLFFQLLRTGFGVYKVFNSLEEAVVSLNKSIIGGDATRAHGSGMGGGTKGHIC